MAIINKRSDPWGEEASFEQMATKTASSAQTKIKKAVGDAVKTIASDVKEQFTTSVGDRDRDRGENVGSKKTQEETEKEKQELLAQTRQNLKRLNDEIRQAYEARLKKDQEKVTKDNNEKKKQIMEVKEQKQKESALQAAIKRSQGSGERGKVAG